MTNAVLQAIADRRSNRGYAPRQLTEEELGGDPHRRRAGAQRPQHAAVALLRGAERRAFEGVFRRLQRPAGRPDPGRDILFFEAPTVVFISTPIEAPTKFSQIDCGIAAQNMALAAHSIGLGSVILGRPMDVFQKAQRACVMKRPSASRRAIPFAIAVALGEPTLTKEAHVVREGLVTRV